MWEMVGDIYTSDGEVTLWMCPKCAALVASPTTAIIKLHPIHVHDEWHSIRTTP